MEKVDILKCTINDLKVIIFDEMRIVEKAQKNVHVLLAEIEKREKEERKISNINNETVADNKTEHPEDVIGGK